MNFELINTKEINGIFSTIYKNNNKIDIVNFINELQKRGYEIKSVGIENNSDIGERTLYPDYQIQDFISNYENIINSNEYVSTGIVLDFNNEIIRICISDNKLAVISYNELINLEDILKKNEYYK